MADAASESAEEVVTGTEGGDDAPGSLDEALGGDGALIDQIEQSLGKDVEDGPTATRLELDELHDAPTGGADMRDLDLLSDVEVEVAVEFGRTRIPLRKLLTLRRGALVELARRPEQQVTVLANGTPIALGDVVVVDDQVGVHIVELIDPKTPAPLLPGDAGLPLTEVREPIAETAPTPSEVPTAADPVDPEAQDVSGSTS